MIFLSTRVSLINITQEKRKFGLQIETDPKTLEAVIPLQYSDIIEEE